MRKAGDRDRADVLFIDTRFETTDEIAREQFVELHGERRHDDWIIVAGKAEVQMLEQLVEYDVSPAIVDRHTFTQAPHPRHDRRERVFDLRETGIEARNDRREVEITHAAAGDEYVACARLDVRRRQIGHDQDVARREARAVDRRRGRARFMQDLLRRRSEVAVLIARDCRHAELVVVKHPSDVSAGDCGVDIGDPLREFCIALGRRIFPSQDPARHQRAILVEDDSGSDERRVDEQIGHAFLRDAGRATQGVCLSAQL